MPGAGALAWSDALPGAGALAWSDALPGAGALAWSDALPGAGALAGADVLPGAGLPVWPDAAAAVFLSGGYCMRHSDFRIKNGVFLTVFSVRLTATAAKLPSVRQRRLERQ